MPIWNTQPTTIIHKHTDSYFGVSLTNLGDVNDDGKQDIAVGAPYSGLKTHNLMKFCGFFKKPRFQIIFQN